MPGPFKRFRAFRARWRRTHDAVQELGPRVDEVRGASDAALDVAESAGERARHAVAVADGAQAAVDRLGQVHADVVEALARLERAQARTVLHARVPATTRWIGETPVAEEFLVSVVLPTRNRPDLLRRAIESVRDQAYTRWELLVVEDGEVEVGPVVDSFDDDRIRLHRGAGIGPSAARNLALREARGAVIAYLDDDNRMQPLWLKAVVWAFGRRPDVEMLYGARLVENTRGAGSGPENLLPSTHFEPFHRQRLEEANFIDMGVLAHRAGMEEARFDEDLHAYVDWDLVLRLTRTRPPMMLPVIACSYSTTAPDRIQDHPRHRESHDAVRAKVAARRNLRILAYTSMYPLVSETYISDELEALCRIGADLVYARKNTPPVLMSIDRPLYQGLQSALDDYQPDVLFLHWLGWAYQELPRIEATGLPFAVRTHSFDFDPEMGKAVMSHPNCIGLWAFPDHAPHMPGAHALPPIFTSVDAMPPPAANRDLVVSVSAGLPKKDWPLLIDAMGRIEGAERQVILATTLEFEEVPVLVSGLAQRYVDPPTVRVDVPRNEVFRVLSRAAAMIYTLEPEQTFGMPMSVVEGLCAGASVILPDRPEARRFAGPAARFYSTADDIVGHAKEVLAGGPAIEDEQAANHTYGMRTFADPMLGQRFYAELVEALDRWRARKAVSPPS